MPLPTEKVQPCPTPKLHYRLTNSEWLRAIKELKPRERDILYYLRTLDPFGDKELTLSIRAIASDIGCSPGTVSDALKSLDRKDWIDLELSRVKIRLKSQHEVKSPSDKAFSESDRPSDHRSPQRSPIAPAISHSESDRSNDPAIAPAISDRPSDHVETAMQLGLQEFSTSKQSLPKQTDQTLKEQIGELPVEIGASTTGNIDSKADFLLCEIEKGCTRINELTGVIVNPPLRAVIEKLGQSNPERLEERITATISAYLEQRKHILNPQAWLSASLQRGFTSNDWKQKQKPKQQSVLQPEKQRETNVPRPAAAVPIDLSGLILDIRMHCERLGIRIEQALERFGRPGKNLTMLSDLDLATLRMEMAGW